MPSEPLDADVRLQTLPGVREHGPLRLAGLRGRFDPATGSSIPGLWDRLIAAMPIAGQAGGETYGVTMPAGPDGGFDYLAAVPLAPGVPEPKGLEAVEIPAAGYAIFRLTITGADLHSQMAAAFQESRRRLKQLGLQKARAPELEVYPPDFDQRRAGDVVEYWIPVSG